MDVTLKNLCVEHDLAGIGVNVFGAPAKPYIVVYVHWDGADHTCASGNGDTFNEALAAALAEMATRQKQDADNAAEQFGAIEILLASNISNELHRALREREAELATRRAA